MAIELKKILLFTLTKEQLVPYQKLLLPSAQFLLQKLQSEEGYCIAVEARQEGLLIGLAVAEIYFSNQTAQLYSLFVEETYRRQGIGLALFRFLQDHLVQGEGVRAIGFEYEKNDLYAGAIERILFHQQWEPPKLYLVRCHFNAYQFNPSWIHLPYKLPPSLTLFPWKELSAREREDIACMADQGLFLPHLSPLRQEDAIDLATSVGLRTEKRVIGWSITHRVACQTIRYTTLYIDKAFYFSGHGIRLLVESIRLHKQLPVPRALFEINLGEIDPSWQRFVKKRLIPYSDRIERMKWALKIFI